MVESRQAGAARSTREPLIPGDFEGAVEEHELDRAYSESSSLRWEYQYVTNQQFWALRHVLPLAIFLEFGVGLAEYDWKKTKAFEVFSIVSVASIFSIRTIGEVSPLFSI